MEGSELDVLKTIPFDEFDIKVISAEFEHEGVVNQSHNIELKKYMQSRGYEIVTIVTAHWNLANDYIFVKKDLLKNEN